MKARKPHRRNAKPAQQSRCHSQKIPKFRHHKASGQGFVELNGRRIYLGRFDLPHTRKKYHQVIAEWLEAGRQLPVAPDEITVLELIDRFTVYAADYYTRPDGTRTFECSNICQALRPVKKLYSYTLAADFGPLALRAVRGEMIKKGWCRTNVNKMIRRVRLMFRWATEQELIPGNVYHALQAVAGLKHGRGHARESEPVKPVPQDQIDALKPFVSGQVWAMIQLQLLTAARAGEVCAMRACDIDREGKVWLYLPAQHKTAHHGHSRTIYIGPRGQDILGPFLLKPAEAFCFSPREAEQERRRKAHERRTTPLTCGNRPGTNRTASPRKQPGERYTTTSYGTAIRKACEAAFPPPPPLAQREGETKNAYTRRLTKKQKAELREWQKAHRWHSHQLRHNAATFLRREFGIEAARIILGHRSAAITETYAELDRTKAVEAMLKVG